jgi:hypothetical protein
MLHAGAALACSLLGPPFYVVKQRAPSGGATPLNTPLTVQVAEDADGPVVESFESFKPSVTLTKAGSAIELKYLGGLRTVDSGVEPLSWVPVEPLEPETTYEAHFNPGYEGIPDSSWAFTTGSESTPALALEGALAVTFEAGTETDYDFNDCPADSCGFSSCPHRVVKVTKARVKIPRAFGGFPRRLGTLWVTDDEPFDFTPASETDPEPNGGHRAGRVEFADLDNPNITEVLITVPEVDTPYRPCFAFAASDLRGDQVTIDALCVDPPKPLLGEGGAANDPDSGASGGPATPAPNDGRADDVAKPTSTSSQGCGFGAERADGRAWLAALGLLLLLRRRAGQTALSAAPRP